jgi:hypothetical protein
MSLWGELSMKVRRPQEISTFQFLSTHRGPVTRSKRQVYDSGMKGKLERRERATANINNNFLSNDMQKPFFGGGNYASVTLRGLR